ncbi:Na/Pi cotransporter family protein [Celeribacter indicus]|uniref:Sodium-dependent inorganic phosphate (Pi) transporter n=1 Tax=Celeribacter indicus TaxID=1208324 RepID=A0A0B5E065_9RHOB|nr:Na/Pi cotransporter family protein [Celeribacter indicus]AJE45847.1 sodium-dependent inorganic phosphate (Pi) transporter [Celeribacter indicus]SDW62159.1 phosphate:Na+ symporter [Celeribacter indicus]
MASLVVFFQIGGAVALLLFGLGLVRDGVTTAFGLRLKTALGLGTRTGPRAFFSGLVATLGLQSSTSTALLTASFLDRQLMGGRMSQVVLLGANVGTALTALIISVGLGAIAPALILIGFTASRRERPVVSGSGRALIGLGLMLISLTLLEAATTPLREASELAAFLAMLDAARPVALLFAACIAAVCSSSLAAVMLVMTLDVPAGLCVALVLGANLGGAIPPVLVTAKSGVAARRLTLGNLFVRAAGCLLVLPLAGYFGATLERLPVPITSLAVEAHLAFNILLSLCVAPFAGLLSRGLELLLPEPEPDGEAPPQWLDEQALEVPLLALGGASRQALSIGDDIARMLDLTRLAFRRNDSSPLAEVSALENRVDLRQQQVKTYLSRLGRDADEHDRRRAITILDYVINLEHVGDIIEKGLAANVRKKVGLQLRFSDAGYDELDAMFLMTAETLRMAQTIFMTRDMELARQLIQQKVEIRNRERQSAQRHLVRLREGHQQTRETSSLHLDILRDLKRISAHLVAVAHPILDEEGLLIESRLR